MSVTLSCGCTVESQDFGIFCEWDAYSRECKEAIAYGVLCAKHYHEYEARPTEQERKAQEK